MPENSPSAPAGNGPLLELDSIRQVFHSTRESVVAVKDVSLNVGPGEVVCLVGQSGSGKSTLAKIAAGLRRPTGGQVRYDGKDVYDRRNRRAWKTFRRGVQYVHQDPYASLNPIQDVYTILSAPLLEHKLVKGPDEAEQRVRELLLEVDLKPADRFISLFPHQMSGGQRQRVAVARSLTLNPKVILADEATSMLDVSIRIGLLEMLTRLRVDRQVGMLFITHDLAMAKFFGAEGTMAVMRHGAVVESGPTLDVIERPQHPYTQALLEACPEPDPDLAQQRRTARRLQEATAR
ncbi:ABC transporter ATP-binding protein [Microlunatus sp. GCM10028923]|uniref:ABC transporter ATP-binding protein n=1 Tax=Microlunatus sp. GCM10028923 TaxID=3273400 RepID=UPI00360C4C1C